MMILTRFHYSIDIFLGIVLTCLTFKLYHHYIRTMKERQGIFPRFLKWFEFMPADSEAWPESVYGGDFQERAVENPNNNISPPAYLCMAASPTREPSASSVIV